MIFISLKVITLLLSQYFIFTKLILVVDFNLISMKSEKKITDFMLSFYIKFCWYLHDCSLFSSVKMKNLNTFLVVFFFATVSALKLTRLGASRYYVSPTTVRIFLVLKPLYIAYFCSYWKSVFWRDHNLFFISKIFYDTSKSKKVIFTLFIEIHRITRIFQVLQNYRKIMTKAIF